MTTWRRSCWVAVALTLLVWLGTSVYRGDPPATTAAGAAPPGPVLPAGVGPTRHVGPTEQPCAGVDLAPGDDIQGAVDAHAPGTTFCLAAGTHRLEAPVVPRAGDSLIGRRGAVLSGSKILAGWRPDGRAWSTTGFLPSAPGAGGECADTTPTCGLAEDVFLDGHRLDRVGSASEVTPGTVHADYATNTITIGDDPQQRLVEQAVASSIVRATVDDVTVANLVIEQAANGAQVGAIESRQVSPLSAGAGWRVLGNEVRGNHGVGVGVGDRSAVTGNLIQRQGQLGLGVWGVGAVVADNDISFNGTAGYSGDWEAGGSKLWSTQRVVLAHNDVHDNAGPGLWADGGNLDTVYEYNRIVDNGQAGIQHEISYDAIIRFNEVVGNGRRHKGWAWDAGIQIQSSGGLKLIEIAHNVVTDNANGITLIQGGHREWEDPAPHGPHIVRNVWVHDNAVTMATGQTTGAVEDVGDPSIFGAGNNRFDANGYYLPALDGAYFVWGGDDLSWDRWRGSGAGNDRNGWVAPLAQKPVDIP